MLFDLIHILEVLKNAILEDCVELILNSSQNGSGLERVDALITEGFLPVELLKIVNVETMQHVHDASDHLGLVQRVVRNARVLARDILCH